MNRFLKIDLLPDEMRKTIPKLYAQEHERDPIVYVKFFAPMTLWHWYGTEFDGEDIFFGWIHGDYPELGYFSIGELESILIAGLLPIERDVDLPPKTRSSLN